MPDAATDVLVIGGGAAGLMCAIEAGKRGRRVTVLEHNAEIGRKILISGGGRCNFTNLHTRPDHFLSANPHFAKSALARYGARDFVELVERHGIPYHEKKLGQLFCDRSARDIVGMLGRECAAARVNILTACTVHEVRKAASFTVETDQGCWKADSLVIASGGLSIPKIGATPFGYGVAKQFGVEVLDCRPALVPLTFGKADLEQYGGLAGLSTGVTATAGGLTFREKMLFTHRGISGPAILQASTYWRAGEAIDIDLLPGIDLIAELRARRSDGDRSEPRTVLSYWLPKRLADRWFDAHGVLQAAVWHFKPAGTEGYAKAEVTAGGVDTACLSSKTFEAKKTPGLYFIGEVLDVTGQLGGFNFQWAWASGYSAGQYV